MHHTDHPQASGGGEEKVDTDGIRIHHILGHLYIVGRSPFVTVRTQRGHGGDSDCRVGGGRMEQAGSAVSPRKPADMRELCRVQATMILPPAQRVMGHQRGLLKYLETSLY